MRTLLIGLFLCLPIRATTTLILTSADATNAQIEVQFTTNQTGTCTVKVSTVNDFSGAYVPIHDVDTSLFSGSDQCNRAGNIVNGNRYTLIIGKRAAELGSDGIHRYSRALQTVTTYYYSITIGSDTLTGSVMTGNIPLGNSRNDPRFDRTRPGEYAFPSIDWTSAGKTTKYVDPATGVALRRATGPGELFPVTTTGRTFGSPTGGTGWTGSVYTGSGTPGAWLRLRLIDPSPAFDGFQSVDALQLVVTLSGTATGVEACITNDGATCSGALLPKTITGTPVAYTFGTTVPILDSWMNSPVHPSNFIDIQPRTGNVTKSGTSVTWNSGAIFNPSWGAGSIITLGGTDCVIATLTHEKTAVLSDSGCKADGTYDYVGRNWGFLIRTTTAGTLTVATPTWTSVTTGAPLMGSYGSPRMCSPVKYDGGFFCSTATSWYDGYGPPLIYWFGDDGTLNQIGLINPTNIGGLESGGCYTGEGAVWDWTVPGKYWCIGFANGGKQVVYSVQYSGDHSANVITPNSTMPDTVATVISSSSGISAEVTAFSASDPNKFGDFSCQYGWRMIGRQGSNLMMYCLETGQDTSAWMAIYSTVSNSIVAATCTYCGQPMAATRWDVLHAQTIAGDTGWVLVGTNPYLRNSSSVTSGSLTSSLSTCPTNSVNPAIAGQSQCSTLTLDSLQPLYMGASLYGQNWELGDIALVLADGVEDRECVRMLKFPSGSQVVVQRDYHPYACNGLTLQMSKMDHTGTLTLRVQPSVYKEFWWDFEHDAHGTDATATYTREDPDSADCHEIFELGIYIVGCIKDAYIPGVVIRTGNPPASFANSYHVINPDGGFMGSTYVPSTTCNESHPSIGQIAAPTSEQGIILDLRPQLCDSLHATSIQMSHVSGRIYKMSAAGSADLQYRKQGFVVNNGTQPMVDVSPAVLSDTQGDEYKFCFVILAGDCYSGSTVGETYFNVRIATTGFETPERFVDYPLNTLHDINLTQHSQTMQSLMQSDALRPTPFGEGTRRLSSAFAPYRIQSTYWNGHALPDNGRAYFVVEHLEGVRAELLVADLPPWPVNQSTNRGTGSGASVGVFGLSGDSFRIRFGYAENGPATSLFCHERQVACATDSSGTQPFLWTDETQSWQTCTGQCSIPIPAISGRAVYYVVDRKNGSGVISSSGIQAMLVP